MDEIAEIEAPILREEQGEVSREEDVFRKTSGKEMVTTATEKTQAE